jgi:hypothetical protein
MKVLLVVGIVGLSGAFLSVPLSQALDISASGESKTIEAPILSSETYNKTLVSVFEGAESQVQDREIGGFYQKLVAAYALDKSMVKSTESNMIDPSDMLPDVKTIQNTALTLPFQEAGKNIQDKELAEFYQKFVTSAGLVSNSK